MSSFDFYNDELKNLIRKEAFNHHMRLHCFHGWKEFRYLFSGRNTKSSINIFLDDKRDPYKDMDYMSTSDLYLEGEWVIVRNYIEFKKLIDDCIQNNITPSIISFDHDLIDKHSYYADKEIDYDSFTDEKEFTGFHALKMYFDKVIADELLCANVIIFHSWSKTGIKNMKELAKEKRREHDKLKKMTFTCTPVSIINY